MNEHTPGPWKAVHRHANAKPTSNEMSGLGWEIYGPPEPMRGQFSLAADAHLIAAAPSMYAALEVIRDDSALTIETIRMIAADIIAKATGQEVTV